MFSAARLIRIPHCFSSNVGFRNGTGGAGLIRFHQVPAAGGANNKNIDEMENSQDPKKGDVMSHSFGEGYATRSDEEGFGGTFSGNQSLPKGEQDKIVHGNSPEYDKNQGSEVKEKEKARHQTNAQS